MLPEPFIGRWSSGEPIDIVGVPLVLSQDTLSAPTLMAPYEAANGGTFTATYHFKERRSNGHWIYELRSVIEEMPPRPPQIQGYGDDVRGPVMERGGFSASGEAEQRKREWAEVLNVA